MARTLARRGVSFLFTLCGGHISPILVGVQRAGIRVIDVRDEATAVFAADAVSRITGRPGVAAVTAGPGLTNSITALKNAQLAQSPLVLLGGATATLLKGRGALQDIDQQALLRPHVKWFRTARRVRDVEPLLEEAFEAAQRSVPGPVFLELPVDLLYPEPVVRSLYGLGPAQPAAGGQPADVARLERHLERLFDVHGRQKTAARPQRRSVGAARDSWQSGPAARYVQRAAKLIGAAERPLLLAGSAAASQPAKIAGVVQALEALQLPSYLSGMARGLLGREHPLLFRHRRREAMREADVVILAGVPCDFRLDYGRSIAHEAAVISIQASAADVARNRKPTVGVRGGVAGFLTALARALRNARPPDRSAWFDALRARDADREREIEALAREVSPPIHPILLCRAIDAALDDDSILIADGGDFVATASYVTRPRGPLSWLDPGPFGTLGVGAGFALGAKLCRPGAEVWLIYGDGSAGFSIMEIDTLARHGVGVIAVVGNDAAWMQIARDQTAILGDDVGTVLARSDYHAVAQAWGGRGLLLDDPARMRSVLHEAKMIARSGVPVVINAHLGRSEFRKGSVSL